MNDQDFPPCNRMKDQDLAPRSCMKDQDLAPGNCLYDQDLALGWKLLVRLWYGPEHYLIYVWYVLHGELTKFRVYGFQFLLQVFPIREGMTRFDRSASTHVFSI